MLVSEICKVQSFELLVRSFKSPALRLNESGQWLVQLGEKWIRVADVSEQLRKSDELLNKFRTEGVSLDWLIRPDYVPSREDKPKDSHELELALETLEQRSIVVAQRLAVELLDLARQKDFPLPEQDLDLLAERILRCLTGVAREIEAKLPRALRRAGRAKLFVERDDAGVRAYWHDYPASAVDLNMLVRRQADVLGELSGQAAMELSSVLLDALFSSQSRLPGFSTPVGNESAEIYMDWIAPVVQTSSSESASVT
jgi:hypothetical protein